MSEETFEKFCILFEKISLDYPENSKRKNFFLAVCKVFDPNIPVALMNKNYPYGGLIGYGNSYLDPLFSWSKIFRIHAAIHDAAGSVRATTNKGPGYSYLLAKVPSCFLLGHVSGLIWCLCLKYIYNDMFNKIDI